MTRIIIAQETLAGDPMAAAVAEARHTREQWALELFQLQGHLIERMGGDIYHCPSSDGKRFYQVDYHNETCNCPDAAYRSGLLKDVVCKHVLAVGIAHAKRRKRRQNFIHAFFVPEDEE